MDLRILPCFVLVAALFCSTFSSVSMGPTTTPSQVEHSNLNTPSNSTPTTSPNSISLTTACVPLRFLRMNLISVGSELIFITWDTNNTFQQPQFTVTISTEHDTKQIQTQQNVAEFRHLQPGVQYQITISITTCGQQQTITRKLRTVDTVVDASPRIANKLIAPKLIIENNQKFDDFVKNFTDKLEEGLCTDIRDLIKIGKLTLTVKSIEEGNVVIQFALTTSVNLIGLLAKIKELIDISLNNKEMCDKDFQSTTISGFSSASTTPTVTSSSKESSNTSTPSISTPTTNTLTTTPTTKTPNTTNPITSTVVITSSTTSPTSTTTTAPTPTSSIIPTPTSTTPTTPTLTIAPTSTSTTPSTPISPTTPTSTITSLPTLTTIVLTQTSITPTTTLITTTTTPISTTLTTVCAPLRFLRMNLISVESEVISITWDTNNASKQHNFSLTISTGNGVVRQIQTEQKAARFSGLQPGVEYQIKISTTTCGQQQTITRKVRTVAAVVEVSTRITNVPFAADLKNESSQGYKNFVKNFTDELMKGLSPAIQALIRNRKLTITVVSIEEGSVVVNFEMASSTNVTVPVSDIKQSVADSLANSSVFAVDLQNTTISDKDSCQPGQNDCSGNGTCIRLNATYTCKCKAGFNDTSPNVPGRTCEDIDECQTRNTCSDLSVCMNTPGNFSCSCFQGIVDSNPANPGTQCRDPNTCFVNQMNICDLSKCSTMVVSECSNRKAFRMKATLRSRKFNNELKNPSSAAYRKLSAEITSAVVQTVQSQLKDDNFNITIIGFESGSVIVNLLAFLSPNSNVTTEKLQSAFANALKAVDNQSSVTVTGTTQASTATPTQPQTISTVQIQPGFSGFRVATIILGVFLGLALLIVATMIIANFCMLKKYESFSF
ncbi:uncharacterized protein LOC144506092 [Mustelus asterias]